MERKNNEINAHSSESVAETFSLFPAILGTTPTGGSLTTVNVVRPRLFIVENFC